MAKISTTLIINLKKLDIFKVGEKHSEGEVTEPAISLKESEILQKKFEFFLLIHLATRGEISAHSVMLG